jgi:hypothetical protein
MGMEVKLMVNPKTNRNAGSRLAQPRLMRTKASWHSNQFRLSAFPSGGIIERAKGSQYRDKPRRPQWLRRLTPLKVSPVSPASRIPESPRRLDFASPTVLDDRAHDRQTLTHSHSLRFGREESIKEPWHDLGSMPFPEPNSGRFTLDSGSAWNAIRSSRN